MPIPNTALNFPAEFLLKFTKELIENTETYKKARLKEEVVKVIKEEKETRSAYQQAREKAILARDTQIKEIKNSVQQKIKKDDDKIRDVYIRGLPLEEELAMPINTMTSPWHPKSILRTPLLQIHEHPLPPTVNYIKPVPTAEQINMGKLNSFVQDPGVRIIECGGPNENIFVGGSMGRKPTAIKLSEEEIEEILGRFSSASKIPVNEGLFKAAIGNMIISAVVSDIVGIKFVIRKIS